MKDESKTKEQLIGELTELRQRIAELEIKEAEYYALFNNVVDPVFVIEIPVIR